MGDDGRLIVENVEDIESLSPAAKNKMVQPMIKRLSDPDQKAAIAHCLSAIFPSLPRELVRYAGKHDFAMNLTLNELLILVTSLGSALTPAAVEAKPSQEELAQAANIARLEEELKLAKSGKGFGK